MYARVTHYQVLPGKLEEFAAAADSLMPVVQRLKGFRLALVLKGDARDQQQATTVSVWESLEDLHAGDNNVFYYQAVTRLLKCCDGFPTMDEQEVLVSEFALQ